MLSFNKDAGFKINLFYNKPKFIYTIKSHEFIPQQKHNYLSLKYNLQNNSNL